MVLSTLGMRARISTLGKAAGSKDTPRRSQQQAGDPNPVALHAQDMTYDQCQSAFASRHLTWSYSPKEVWQEDSF